MGEGTTERYERTRQEILATARQLMREEGVGALTLGAVARRMKMRTPSLYYYFPNKMALYDALFRDGMELFGGWMEEGDAGGEPLDLERRMERFFAFGLANPELYQLLFERPVPSFVPSEESMAVSYRNLARLGEVLEISFDRAGIQPPLPAEQARDILIALAHGVISLHLANEPQLPLGEGRWGSLVPAVVALLHAAWGPEPTDA